MTSYQHRKSHCGDKTILRPSYLNNGISYTGKTTSLYWIRAQCNITKWPLLIWIRVRITLDHSSCVVIWSRFLSLAWSKLRLCSANHRADCDWLSIVRVYPEQETENALIPFFFLRLRKFLADHRTCYKLCNISSYWCRPCSVINTKRDRVGVGVFR